MLQLAEVGLPLRGKSLQEVIGVNQAWTLRPPAGSSPRGFFSAEEWQISDGEFDETEALQVFAGFCRISRFVHALDIIREKSKIFPGGLYFNFKLVGAIATQPGHLQKFVCHSGEHN